jgi:hypothetical protein
METKDLIRKIEKDRNSKVISYITSDRKGPFSAKIAPDVIPIINKHLEALGRVDNIDLFLYSTGGDTMVPWRLVSMIRNYCTKFSVIVPYKAHSAATMIALGADQVVMSNLSELSPIDPSTANIFNPVDPQNAQNRVPISVEDVMAYFDLAKKKFGINNAQELGKIFSKFIEANPQIHPLALGNINRIHNLIRILAKRLLKSHRRSFKEEEIEKIVNYFTEQLYSHDYLVGRKEAYDDLGLKTVLKANQTLSELMTKLYEEYKKEMNFDSIWNPENEFNSLKGHTNKIYKIALIESYEIINTYEITSEFKKQQTPQGVAQIPQEQIVWRVVNQGWK